MKYRRVRLVDKPKFPNHAKTLKAAEGNHKWKDWRGKKIKVAAFPRMPSEAWKCRTPNVWPVSEETLAAMGIDMHFADRNDCSLRASIRVGLVGAVSM